MNNDFHCWVSVGIIFLFSLFMSVYVMDVAIRVLSK